MNKRILSKILATILVLMLTFSNGIMLAVYAAGEALENQQTSISKTKIEFDAFFKTEDNKVHSIVSDINTDNNLYLEIKVVEGVLKNVEVSLQDSNFRFKNLTDNQGIIQSIDRENDRIYLYEIGKGTDITIEIPVEIIKNDNISADYFTKESKVILSGEYINNFGDQLNIQKEIKLLMQLHGQADLILEQLIDKYVPFSMGQMKGSLIQSTITAGIQNNNLPIKQIMINVEAPVINNIKPLNAIVVGKESTYNSQTGILTIVDNNNIEGGQIKWNRNGANLYKVIYLYGDDAYTENAVISEQKVHAEINVYNDNETRVTKDITEQFLFTQKIRDIVSNKISINKQDLYKGFLYNNSKNETIYQTTWTADIGYTNLIDEIILSEDGDKFVYDSVSSESTVPNYAYYKTTYIGKYNFERVLGTDGYIDIYDANNNKIARINKDSNIDEKNNYFFNYNNEINKITIKTSKPVDNLMGEELVVRNEKAIKSPINYELNWLEAFNYIETSLNQEKARTNLREIETKIEASSNKETLSTAITNNIEFTVALRTDSAKYNLFKNPVIDIKLPSYVQTIELGNVDVLYSNDELTLASRNVYTDNEGNKIIRIVLSGEQTDYIVNSASKGINLFVSANITTDKFMPSQDANIQVTCLNGKDNSNSVSTINMKFISESGVLMANSISNYNGDGSITSLKGDVKIGNLSMNTVSKVATMDITLINNEKADISGAVILGRLPFENNKTAARGEDLQSTFTAQLNSAIAAYGINATVLYSENGNADINMQNSENKWISQATTNTKSYMIVFNEAFKKGQTVKFEYQITIPENLGIDQASYSNYAVYYNNQVSESPIVGMATTQRMIQQHRQQLEEQNIDVTNAIESNTPKGEDLVSINTQYIKESANDSKIGLNDSFIYIINVKNNTYHTLDDIKIIDVLSRNLKYEECQILSSNQEAQHIVRRDIEAIYNSANHNITINVIKLDAQEELTLEITVTADSYLADGIVNNCIISSEEIYKTQPYVIQMKDPAVLTANITGSELSKEVKPGQNISYTILINNSGGDNAYVTVEQDLPEGLILTKSYYYLDAQREEINDIENNSIRLFGIPISPGRSLKLVLEAEVEKLPDDMLQRELDTFALITGRNINIQTETVKYTVKKDQMSPTDKVKSNISGIVWNDENENGKRDVLELGISDIDVNLIDESGKIVNKTKTNNAGGYIFENLDNGTYIVMFEHDSKLYRATVYKKDNVIETLNSDAKETIYDGKKVAMTDSIVIEDSSKTNINLGLIKNSIFDLKLDKYIDTITVQNDQGVTTYNYTDTNFAKVELIAKYIPSTTVILEYKIAVKNEGDVPGYVKQIVDYLPQDLKFSSELNKDWYVNTDGNLYTSGLADIIINPGETKEVNLIVTKKMNDNNTGLVTNQAEIAESYNEQGVEEYDSTPMNKNQNEDDISTASLIIGVKTGGAVLYITITLVCIAILGVGTYIINKKVLRGIK